MADPEKTARALVAELGRRVGPRLRSALLYGSVARGEAVEGVSDINVLVLLEEIDADALHACAPTAKRWVDAGNTAPLLMAWSEWRRAADVFAIEMADMRDAHRVLHGQDPLDGLSIDPGELRLQAERELRGKLVQLREGMLLSADEPNELGRLLLTALPSFTTYLRTVLRLAGREVAPATPRVVRSAAALVDGPPDAFLRTWEARRRRRVPAVEVEDPIVAEYYALVKRTAAYVDRMTHDGGDR